MSIDEDLDYSPYGIVVYGTPTDVYQYNGKEWDSESGLNNFGARYDASTLGRFMTPDWAANPINVPYANFGNPQSLNLYSYVENNPATLGDPDGHMFWAPALSSGEIGNISFGIASAAGQSELGAGLSVVGTLANSDEAAKQAASTSAQAQNKVAMAAEKEALGLTRAALKEGHHVEYGGWIIKSNKDGSLSYTKPSKGGEGEIDMDKIPVPKGFSVIAEYHTHPHTTSAEGEGADAGDLNHLRYVAGIEHVDRPGYVADTYSGNVYRYTQWEPIKSLYDPRTFGTNIGNIPPD